MMLLVIQTVEIYIMKAREEGYTLIELMIGLIVGLIVLSGVIYIFLATLSSSRDVLNSTRLNQELSVLNDVIAGEIRRSGYWYVSASTASGADSPYADLTDEIDLAVVSDAGPSVNCVLFSYDRDEDQTVETDERSGFRRVLDGGIGVVRIKRSGSSMTDCTEGNWEAITDPAFLDVTDFTIAQTEVCFSSVDRSLIVNCTASSAFVGIRKIDFEVSGQVESDPTWSGTVTDSVKIRNNKVIN